MLNFPIPYPDELIYSTVARYGIHFGLTSALRLLDDVYQDRNLIATTDLPSHLSTISNHLKQCGDLSGVDIAYQHTLFPLYAPFVPETRRKNCLKWMLNSSKGAVHLALGVSASKVKRTPKLRYCPKCLHKQKQTYGEYYWNRTWQITGSDSCLEHGKLVTAGIDEQSYHRHQYCPATPEICPVATQGLESLMSGLVGRHVDCLLHLLQASSPTYSQWSSFYKGLACDNGCCHGKHVQHSELMQLVLQQWPSQWLKEHGVGVDESETNWLRTIFRKHRKSFSYLQHIVVLEALIGKSWTFEDVLMDVRRISTHQSTTTSSPNIDEAPNVNYRSSWANLAKRYGVQPARSTSNGGAIYAWLYRHDREWLLAENKRYRIAKPPVNGRVDWKNKDSSLVAELSNIRSNIKDSSAQPRMTRNWFLIQLPSFSSIEKNLYRLPKCQTFFEAFCEGVPEYQIRRIKRTIAVLSHVRAEMPRWKVLRSSGLSDERLTSEAKIYLEKILTL